MDIPAIETADTEGLVSGIVDTLMDEDLGLSFVEMLGVLSVAQVIIEQAMVSEWNEDDSDDGEEEVDHEPEANCTIRSMV